MSEFTPQQSAAIAARGNLLVVAGAGTGKTATLIARCLRLVAETGTSLENILMVTFTEAAAGEMRARLRSELLKLQAARPADAHLAQQLALLDAARISTLHSFCLQLAREHFSELGLDPQFGVLDEQQTRPLRREALDEILERHYSSPAADSNAVRELIRTVGRGADKSVRQLILKLHNYTQSLPEPERWLDAQQKQFTQTQPTAWRALFAQAVGAWRDEWQGELEKFRGAAPAVDICRAELEKFTSGRVAETLRAVLQADALKENWPRGTVGKVRDHIAGFFDDAEFLGAMPPNASGVDPLAQDWEWARSEMLTVLALTREFTAAFAAKKRELGGVDFADLEQYALRTLRLPGIAAAWRERLAHVFVDEYQDINAAQDAILTALSRDGKDGNRFLVGDVKQSIYRFRLANPKIFSGYAARWQSSDGDGLRIPLTENFRSRAALLDFVNPLFAALMCAEVGGVAYEPLQFGAPPTRAQLAASGTPSVHLHLIAKPEEENPADETEAADPTDSRSAPTDLLAAEREARLVARQLRRLKDARHQIWDKDANAFRAVEWRDMAVLLRSPGGRAEAFAMEFARAGVPLAAARDGFFASLEISDLLNLLKLLDNPLQDVPLAAVLRSPLVGMSPDELAAVRAQSSAKPFWTALLQQQKKSPPKVQTFLQQFAGWRELARQTSLSQTLETALAETHFEALLLAGERGAERVANVRRFLDLARQFDPYQRQGLYRFLRFVQSQEDEELDLQPATPPAEDAVRLMSIHKSKGLEFPVVVLAGLGTRFNEQDLSATLLLDETLGLCPKITPPQTEQNYPSLAHWLARRTARRELRGEELRLLYVALTRARDTLLLVGTNHRKADATKWPSEPPAPVSTDTVVGARSHLDWLLAWLPQATTDGHWRDDRTGENELLDWKIYDANDAEFADIGTTGKAPDAISPLTPPASAVQKLKARLDWQYPFLTATTEAAKASVSALRRRTADDADDAAEKLFAAKTFRARRTAGKLSAAQIGTAHHTLLQCVPLERAADEAGLREEAEQLRAAGTLTEEEVAALDFAALAGFWRLEVGQRLRALPPGQVQRELPFTARMSAADLRTPGVAVADLKLDDDEFVVVQGVVDLAVLLEDEIWLLDFKTDAVEADGVAAKVKEYEPQLKLYALALNRIYKRPVTNCWLHFLSCGKTAGVKV